MNSQTQNIRVSISWARYKCPWQNESHISKCMEARNFGKMGIDTYTAASAATKESTTSRKINTTSLFYFNRGDNEIHIQQRWTVALPYDERTHHVLTFITDLGLGLVMDMTSIPTRRCDVIIFCKIKQPNTLILYWFSILFDMYMHPLLAKLNSI